MLCDCPWHSIWEDSSWIILLIWHTNIVNISPLIYERNYWPSSLCVYGKATLSFAAVLCRRLDRRSIIILLHAKRSPPQYQSYSSLSLYTLTKFPKVIDQSYNNFKDSLSFSTDKTGTIHMYQCFNHYPQWSLMHWRFLSSLVEPKDCYITQFILE